MIKTNYHTHTIFCDGKNTVEEMVLSAIEKNFDILGFSGHSMYPHASDWHIAPREHENYVKEVRAIQKKYADKIKIYCGFEADYIPSFSMPCKKQFESFNIDYLIGATHYLVNEKGFMTVDDSASNVNKGVDLLFNGNGKLLACEYFKAEREMLSKGDFTILAHADLIRKRNESLHLFKEDDEWYKKEVKATVNEIAKSNVIVEINTGAISRGAMNDVYPSKYFLELLHEKNVPITLSSDSHSCDSLDTAFERALSIAWNTGYREIMIYDCGKTLPQPIKLS